MGNDFYLPEGDNSLEIIMEEIPEIANLYVTLRDGEGRALPGVAITVNGTPHTTDSGGTCSFPGLTPGLHNGSSTKAGYEVTSVVLNGSPIPFANGNF